MTMPSVSLDRFTPLNNQPSNDLSGFYPQITFRAGHLILEFSDTDVETTFFGSVWNRDYNGSGAIVTIMWMSGAVSGTVIWEAAFERHQPLVDVLDQDLFTVALSVEATAPTVSGRLRYTQIVFDDTDLDGLQVSESYRLRIRRTGGTMAAPAQLLRVEVRTQA